MNRGILRLNVDSCNFVITSFQMYANHIFIKIGLIKIIKFMKRGIF